MQYKGQDDNPFSWASTVPIVDGEYVDSVIYFAMSELHFSFVDILNCQHSQFMKIKNIAVRVNEMQNRKQEQQHRQWRPRH